MSNMFEVPDIQKQNQASFSIDTNVLRGFKLAAKQGQIRTAIDYLVYVVDVLAREVESLKVQLQDSNKPIDDTPYEEVKPKKTATKSVEASAE